VVRVRRRGIAFQQPLFLDDRSDKGERCGGDEPIQIPHEPFAAACIHQKAEGPQGLPDLVLMEDHHVVAEVAKLELLQGGRGDGPVVVFSEDAEGEDEDWVLGSIETSP
jgi:hypothetical protein